MGCWMLYCCRMLCSHEAPAPRQTCPPQASPACHVGFLALPSAAAAPVQARWRPGAVCCMVAMCRALLVHPCRNLQMTTWAASLQVRGVCGDLHLFAQHVHASGRAMKSPNPQQPILLSQLGRYACGADLLLCVVQVVLLSSPAQLLQMLRPVLVLLLLVVSTLH
jgi:hypothetical protein